MAKSTAILNVKILSDAKGLTKGLGTAEKKLGGFSKAAKIAGGALAGLAVGKFVKDAILGAEAAATANNRVAQILGQTADVTKSQLDAVLASAEALSRSTGISDEVIKGGQAILGTFKSVAQSAGETNGVFERATKSAADLAAAGFGSLESNSTSLGKALEDPVKGLTALSRSGVTFTESEKERIATLVESNKLGEAQAIILGAIEGQVGGTAEATADWSDKMGVAVENLTQSFGAVLLPVFESVAGFVTEKLVPVVQELIEFFKTGDITKGFLELTGLDEDSGAVRMLVAIRDAVEAVVGWVRDEAVPAIATFGETFVMPALESLIGFLVDDLVPAIQGLVEWAIQWQDILVPLAAAIGAVAAAVVVWNIATGIFNTVTAIATGLQTAFNIAMSLNPVALIVLAVIALAAALVAAYKKSETFRNIVDGVFRFIGNLVSTVANVFKSVWNTAFAVVKGYITVYKNVVVGVFNVIKGVVSGVVSFFTGAWDRIWGTARSVFQRIGSFVSGIINGIRNAFNTVASFVSGILDGIKFGVNLVIGALNNLIRGANIIPGVSIPELSPLGLVVDAEVLAGRSTTIYRPRIVIDGREVHAVVRDELTATMRADRLSTLMGAAA